MSARSSRREFLSTCAGAAASIAAASACISRGGAAVPATRPAALKNGGFYVAADPNYTIFDSVADSLRFTLTRCMTTYKGHACGTSSFVDPTGAIMGWHNFGPLEGPGWASNAAGGAYELLRWSRFTGNTEMRQTALSILDHVLENGFVDRETGLIRGYRHVPTNRIVLNYKHNDDWFCPGSNAKVAAQLLLCSDLDEKRRDALRATAKGYANWLETNVKMLPNGWFPRRCTASGAAYEKNAEGGRDKFFESSADGLFIPQLWAELTARSLGDYRQQLAAALKVFMDVGGFYASINHDTYDAHENVAYSVAFRVFRRASEVLNDPVLKTYALDKILPNLDRFKMREDRNGVATTGLLWMEESWDTSYLWENAEASLACMEAYGETRNTRYLDDGLTILRAAAKHHFGPFGFLTEGVDWNNHVGQQHHINGAKYAAIKYTEPFLNNQHIAEPTLHFLERHASSETVRNARIYKDHEGNVVATVKGAA